MPLEATAESIGSKINQHGSDQRQSHNIGTLSTEVEVAWNGPADFSSETETFFFFGGA